MKVKNQRLRPKNERVSNTRQRRQQHLLDVRVRSHKATQHRNRRVLVLFSKIARDRNCFGRSVRREAALL